jgi:DNA-binding MarR family transcriptional regulator
MIREEALEPALCFMRELWALDHALGSTSKRMHDEMGITAQQRMILRFVGKYPSITAVELATMLHLEKGTLSLALKRLDERGLLTRRRDAADGRKTPIVLTARGRRFDRPAVGTVERAVRKALRITPEGEVETTRLLLQRLVRLLERRAQRDATAKEPAA